jgi:hypothetical protein
MPALQENFDNAVEKTYLLAEQLRDNVKIRDNTTGQR